MQYFGTHHVYRLLIVAVTLVAGLRCAAAADSPRPVHFRESVAIETNLTAQRQLELARVHLAEKHWDQAINLIRQVAANDRVSVVALEPGRYLNVGLYAQLLMSTLPAEGLAAYRKAADDAAQQAFREAVGNHDDTALRALVRESFVSRPAEDALLALGQWAWEAGRVTEARADWERLLPLHSPAVAGSVPNLLRYPDSRIDRAELFARLIMCSIVEGNEPRATAERRFIREHFPNARGQLGGREGILCDLLDGVASKARNWSYPPRDTSVTTFAVNAARNGVLPEEIDVGALRWAADFGTDVFASTFSAAGRGGPGPSIFPAVYGDILFVNTAEQVLAWNLRTGRPAWPSGHKEDASIYPGIPETTPSFPTSLLVGSPRYTMTIDDGHLYARMGAPITARSQLELRESDSHLICLDLQRGEGKLIWKLDSPALDLATAFEGSPMVVDGRAYVSTRRGRSQTQTNVLCLDSETGKRLWDRRICAAVATFGQNVNLVSHQLLSAGDDAVFLSTGMGAIAALEADDGALRWIVTYESSTHETHWQARERAGISPCLIAGNRVYAAPNDTDDLLALDSRTGATLWRRTLPGGIEHLLGAKDDVLIASGQSLWGLDLATGRVIWHVGFTDPASFGYGRGILAGDVVYWPTREEIFVVEQTSGNLRRVIPLLARNGEFGGNLLLAGDSLIVAQSRRIAVYGPYGSRRRKPREIYSYVAPTLR